MKFILIIFTLTFLLYCTPERGRENLNNSARIEYRDTCIEHIDTVFIERFELLSFKGDSLVMQYKGTDKDKVFKYYVSLDKFLEGLETFNSVNKKEVK